MCTLIAIHRQVPGAPLVVAANRDEYYARPAEGPALRDVPAGAVVAPLDLQAGGTWVGINAAGVLAAVTNRRCTSPDETLRSRGWLVMDALASRSAAEAAARLGDLPQQAYNPFNCFVADRNDAFACVYQGAARVFALAPGAHVVGNVEPDARDDAKVARVLERAEKAAARPAHRVLDELAELCREHDSGSTALHDTCVHAGPYGTRSSLLFRLDPSGASSQLLYADGPPCTTAYEDFTPLLDELSPKASYARAGTAARTTS